MYYLLSTKTGKTVSRYSVIESNIEKNELEKFLRAHVPRFEIIECEIVNTYTRNPIVQTLYGRDILNRNSCHIKIGDQEFLIMENGNKKIPLKKEHIDNFIGISYSLDESHRP